jgi:hypothetical protein
VAIAVATLAQWSFQAKAQEELRDEPVVLSVPVAEVAGAFRPGGI